MPSVIIKDMEMPEKCDDCIIYHFAEYPYCAAAADDFPLTEEECAVSCPNWCPLRPAPEWISVEERLPDLFDAVIISILTKNGYDQPVTIETIGCYEHGEWHSFTGRICKGERVTHWRPLPEPPKEAP